MVPGRDVIVVAGGAEMDRQMLRVFIEDAGYPDVRFAADAEEALALLGEADLILVDVMQASAPVAKLLNAARALPRAKAPAMLVTGPPDQMGRVEACLARGAEDYVTHPYLASAVRTRVAQALARRRLSRELDELRAAGKVAAVLGRADDPSTRFVPREFLEYLQRQTLADVRLGDHVSREMTVFFSDIRDFTRLSEAMTPQENFDFLNSYLRHVNPVIRAANGFIDKYIGDAIMALFPHEPEDALTAAIGLMRRVAEYNVGRARANYEEIRIGIGMHRGSLILGTIGEDERMQTTVIADAVNTASRIEGLTKVFGSPILLSDTIVRALPPAAPFRLRNLGAVKAKGKHEHVEIYEAYDNDEERLLEHKDRTKEIFAEGIKQYRDGLFLSAQKLFQRVASKNPDDRPAAYYLERCSIIALRGPAPGRWDGAELMEVK